MIRTTKHNRRQTALTLTRIILPALLCFALASPLLTIGIANAAPAQAANQDFQAAAADLPAPGNLWGQPYEQAYLGGVRLGWDPVGSVTNPSVAAYRVYRADGSQGPFTAVADLNCADEINYLGYIDAGLKYETAYYYRVAALDAAGAEGAVTTAVEVTTPQAKAQTALATTKQLVISLDDQRIYFIENGRVVNILRCSTGAVPGTTPCGTFSILYHVDAMPVAQYPGCTCYYWMGFTSAHGIHAWPAYYGQYSDYSTLGTPQSHGCVRLHPDEAPWAYAWTPDGTTLTIIQQSFMPLPPPIDDGTVSVGATDTSKKWYFAEGYTGGLFTEYILVQNPNSTAANVHTTYMTGDHRQVQHDFQVPAMNRVTVCVDNLPGLDSAEVSAAITSDVGIIAERSMYFEYNGIPGGHDTLGTTATSTNWYLAEGSTKPGFDEYVQVQNPNASAVTATLTFMKSDSSTVTKTLNLPAQSRGTLRLIDYPELQNVDASCQVTAPQGVIAERSMYFIMGGGIMGGHNTLGAPTTSTDWYFAEGCTDFGFSEYLLLQNPNATATNVTVTYMKYNGGTVVHTYPVAAHSRFTVWVNNEAGCEASSLAAQVSSVQPIVAERAMYWLMAGGRHGGHDHIGSTQPAKMWYFAEGYTAGSFDEYILLQNPGDTEADVWLIYMVPGGSPVGYEYKVAPKQRATVHVDETPGIEASEVSTQVSSNVPIIAERSMYFCIPRERQI